MFYTYVLRSQKDNGLYVGCSKGLRARLEAHQKGLVPSTRRRPPIGLIYFEACNDLSAARRRERYLKTYHGKMFLGRRLKPTSTK